MAVHELPKLLVRVRFPLAAQSFVGKRCEVIKMETDMRKKISVGMLSLGCPKTLVDSELVLGRLDRNRYAISESAADCDIALLNTCAFIEDSKQESIDRILELIELKKEGKIKALVVLGCLVQRYPDVLQKEFKQVNAFLGTGEYAKIEEVVEKLSVEVLKENGDGYVEKEGRRYEPFTSIGRPGYLYGATDARIALTPPHFRYVKISEGCDHHCSFCTIPSFRGRHRSRPMDDVVKEVEELARGGCKEVVLTGQDTTHYGKDYSGQFLLPDLLSRLNKIAGIEWIRILYAYPLFVNDRLIDAIATIPKVCHYLDMPLQHISDGILQSMKRGVGKARTVDLIRKLRTAIPDLAIRTTLIVGYPGETGEQFDELLQFMSEAKFERLGIFTYSQEEETPAGEMPNQIPKRIKEKRFQQAMELQQEISKKNNEKWIGHATRVLIDERSDEEPNLYRGRTYMDAPEVDGNVLVKLPAARKLSPGDLIHVKITGALEYDLTADLI